MQEKREGFRSGWRKGKKENDATDTYCSGIFSAGRMRPLNSENILKFSRATTMTVWGKQPESHFGLLLKGLQQLHDNEVEASDGTHWNNRAMRSENNTGRETETQVSMETCTKDRIRVTEWQKDIFSSRCAACIL